MIVKSGMQTSSNGVGTSSNGVGLTTFVFSLLNLIIYDEYM
jgi:hypothetical protein